MDARIQSKMRTFLHKDKDNNKYSLQLKLVEPNSEPRILKKQVISDYGDYEPKKESKKE
mgnify:CR=1 FL=1